MCKMLKIIKSWTSQYLHIAMSYSNDKPSYTFMYSEYGLHKCGGEKSIGPKYLLAPG